MLYIFITYIYIYINYCETQTIKSGVEVWLKCESSNEKDSQLDISGKTQIMKSQVVVFFKHKSSNHKVTVWFKVQVRRTTLSVWRHGQWQHTATSDLSAQSSRTDKQNSHRDPSESIKKFDSIDHRSSTPPPPNTHTHTHKHGHRRPTTVSLVPFPALSSPLCNRNRNTDP